MGCGDNFKFEAFNAKGMLKDIGKNPEKLLLGAATPVGSKLWSGITGKDYKPVVNEWGGPTKERFNEADKAGIDTGTAKDVHKAARAIAAIAAAGYGGQAAGLWGGASGAGAGAGAGGVSAGTGSGLLGEFGLGTAGGSSVATGTAAMPGTFGASSMALPEAGMSTAGGAIPGLSGSFGGGAASSPGWLNMLKQGNQLFGGGGGGQQQGPQFLPMAPVNYSPNYNASQMLQSLDEQRMRNLMQMRGLGG